MQQTHNQTMIALPDLLTTLNNNILNKYNTELVGGFEEPFYKTFKQEKKAEIQFSHDYIRSALHELSHWCVAGVERRKLDDYGYWYAEDGRDQQQQDKFFKVELKPQSIEWAFSIVCGVTFEASVDNLNQTVKGVDEFKASLIIQLNTYVTQGFSPRVTEIIKVIAEQHGVDNQMALIEKQISLK